MRRLLPWITAVAVVAALVWVVFALRDLHVFGALKPTHTNNPMKGIAIRFENPTLVGWADGRRLWSFDAESVELTSDRRTATFEGIKDGVMLQGDKKVATVSAGKVVYDMFSRNVSAPGGVKVELEDGPALKAGQVHWNAATSSLVCVGGINVAMENGILQGDRMTADLANKELTVEKTRGWFKVPVDSPAFGE